jgi:heme oxygenase-like protein
VASGQVLRPLERRLEPLHRRLAEFNRLRLEPSFDVVDWQQQLRQDTEMRVLEGHFIESERAQIQEAASKVPTQPREFATWLDSLRQAAAAQSEPLFHWLAAHATHNDLSWLLAQELAGDDRLEDLLALTQVKRPWRAKIEMARNYWDEMGQGSATSTSARLLEELKQELHMEATEPPVWEVLARSNLMLGLATNRRYGFQVLGALALVELSAAGTAALVNAGLRRLGYSGATCAYFAMRETLSPLRAHSWTEGVLLPLIAQDARTAAAIAEGALMRLVADARCVQRYQTELKVPEAWAPIQLSAWARARGLGA